MKIIKNVSLISLVIFILIITGCTSETYKKNNTFNTSSLSTKASYTKPSSISDCNCSSNLYNCSDFATKGEAQNMYECCIRKTGRDIHWLDDDKDGAACEWN